MTHKLPRFKLGPGQRDATPEELALLRRLYGEQLQVAIIDENATQDYLIDWSGWRIDEPSARKAPHD